MRPIWRPYNHFVELLRGIRCASCIEKNPMAPANARDALRDGKAYDRGEQSLGEYRMSTLHLVESNRYIMCRAVCRTDSRIVTVTARDRLQHRSPRLDPGAVRRGKLFRPDPPQVSARVEAEP
jgi:hypothetical protein